MRHLRAVKTLNQGDIVIKIKGPSFRNMLSVLNHKCSPRLYAYKSYILHPGSKEWLRQYSWF